MVARYYDILQKKVIYMEACYDYQMFIINKMYKTLLGHIL
jgi:hypothetical protein